MQRGRSSLACLRRRMTSFSSFSIVAQPLGAPEYPKPLKSTRRTSKSFLAKQSAIGQNLPECQPNPWMMHMVLVGLGGVNLVWQRRTCFSSVSRQVFTTVQCCYLDYPMNFSCIQFLIQLQIIMTLLSQQIGSLLYKIISSSKLYILFAIIIKHIIEMEKRLTADLIKKIVPVFEIQSYKNAQNKVGYIHDLIEVNLYKRKINYPVFCMNELCDIINQIKIPLKNQQIHQLYLYSTYQRFEKVEQTKKKLLAMVNQEKHKVDTSAMAEWINQKIQNGEIKIPNNQNHPKKSQSEHVTSNSKKIIEKLPPLRGAYSQKLQEQLKSLIEIFQQMQTERQSSGLIPMNENEDDQVQIPSSNIPYDPELYLLNNNLSKLRIKAEDRLARIIELAKCDKKIRLKLEEAIQKFQKQRIEANQKVGRMGAMKAYKRLIEKKKQQIKKIRNLKLGEQQDLVRASHLHALLNLPQIKSTKIIY